MRTEVSRPFLMTLLGVLPLACSGTETPEAIAQRCDALYESFEPTADVSFARDVMPIFQAQCNQSPCHGGSSPVGAQADLWLGPKTGKTLTDEDLAFIVQGLVDVESLAAAGTALVREGKPRDSFLMLKIDDCQDHPGLSCELEGELGGPCGTAMPLDLPELEEKQKAIVRSWIALGARND